jgi:hypothetical protein
MYIGRDAPSHRSAACPPLPPPAATRPRSRAARSFAAMTATGSIGLAMVAIGVVARLANAIESK